MTTSFESAIDRKDHYTAIIAGAGFSGLGSAIQLKRKLGLEDVMIYEKTTSPGGTWGKDNNTYPGAACDIPLTFYSFSFYPAIPKTTAWAPHDEVFEYVCDVVNHFKVNNIVFQTIIKEARFSRESNIWTITLRNVVTGKEFVKTANFFIAATGALSVPIDPPFPPEQFAGSMFHSAKWDHSVEYAGKDVVLVGNGCSASQIVPEIVDKVKTLTQVARSRQACIRRFTLLDSPIWNWMLKWVPGLLYLNRSYLFFIFETVFKISDIVKGAQMRKAVLDDTRKYIRETANKKYWDDLEPDFDIAAKRRIFDNGYYKATNNSNYTLLQGESLVGAEGNEVITNTGRRIHADVVVLATGFKVQDYLFPMKIYNEKGVDLSVLLKENGVKNFQGTLVGGFPNFFWMMGPNTTTGHSSVIFTSECQIEMMVKLLKPTLNELRKRQFTLAPPPTIEVKPEVEDKFYNELRKEMKNKVWEVNGGVSWYADKEKGICTALYPWSQVDFWQRASHPKESDFIRT